MAEVYMASDNQLARDIAVKVLPPALIHDHNLCNRFQKEARLAASMTHPNIIPIYSVGQSKFGQPYIAMAYLSGGSLNARLKKAKLPLDEAINIIRGVLSGLSYAHENGIIHRDIKPDNILFTDLGLPVIADFGIAAALKPGRTATDLRSSIGTPLYMSPEQFEGKKADHRSDLYSAGAVFYEMITGARPFERSDLPGLIYEHINVIPQPPINKRGDLPAAINSAIVKALEKNPDDRFQSAGEFIMALENKVKATDITPQVKSEVEATQPVPPLEEITSEIDAASSFATCSENLTPVKAEKIPQENNGVNSFVTFVDGNEPAAPFFGAVIMFLVSTGFIVFLVIFAGGF
jgi:serine/threonine-protein kinase